MQIYIYSNVKRRRSFVLLIAHIHPLIVNSSLFPCNSSNSAQFSLIQFWVHSKCHHTKVYIPRGKKQTKQNTTLLEQEHHWSDHDLWATIWGHWGGRPPLCFMILNLYWLLFYYFICYPSAFWIIEKNNGKVCCLYRNIMQFVLLGEQVQAIYSLYSRCTLLLILSQYCFSQVFPFFFYKVFALLSFILKTFPDMVLE